MTTRFLRSNAFLKAILVSALAALAVGCFSPVTSVTPEIPASPATVPTAGLIGEWLFDGNANETSGSGQTGDGTVTGAILVSDRSGNANSAYQFDGIDDRIDAPFPDLQIGDQLSFSFWLYADFGQQNIGVALSINTGLATGDLHLDFYGNDQFNVAAVSGGTTNELMSGYNSVFSANAWNHVVLTVDATDSDTDGTTDGSAFIYVNGTEIGSASPWSLATFASDTISIGSRPNFARRFTGAIDDVRVYDRILTATEISELSNE